MAECLSFLPRALEAPPAPAAPVAPPAPPVSLPRAPDSSPPTINIELVELHTPAMVQEL